ncbi:hypothetical protein AOQ84DRAFT_363600, partial [Glonium stellatum]
WSAGQSVVSSSKAQPSSRRPHSQQPAASSQRAISHQPSAITLPTPNPIPNPIPTVRHFSATCCHRLPRRATAVQSAARCSDAQMLRCSNEPYALSPSHTPPRWLAAAAIAAANAAHAPPCCPIRRDSLAVPMLMPPVAGIVPPWPRRDTGWAGLTGDWPLDQPSLHRGPFLAVHESMMP